jgi:hypothetical protein
LCYRVIRERIWSSTRPVANTTVKNLGSSSAGTSPLQVTTGPTTFIC